MNVFVGWKPVKLTTEISSVAVKPVRIQSRRRSPGHKGKGQNKQCYGQTTCACPISGNASHYSETHEVNVVLGKPALCPTPYGGRLEWDMPGGNRIVTHLKEKRKIRHKKRWSQVGVSLCLYNGYH